MRQPLRLTRSQPAGPGERGLFSLFLVVAGVLYLTTGSETWAQVVAWLAIATGVALAILFGIRFFRQEAGPGH